MPSPRGTRIRDARRKAGFKNAESFAVALGVGVRTVQRWEQNGTDNYTRLAQIAELTETPVAELTAEPMETEVAA